jgi:hypothetical protein
MSLKLKINKIFYFTKSDASVSEYTTLIFLIADCIKIVFIFLFPFWVKGKEGLMRLTLEPKTPYLQLIK